ncbi:MAG: hypothetical protein WAZ14_03010 [Patescibacteria group bacterium]
MSSKVESIIRFKGEFPNTLLDPIRAMARILAPYDELLEGCNEDDQLTIFDLMEYQNCLSDEFRTLLYTSAVGMLVYQLEQYNLTPKPGKRHQFTKRFYRALNGIQLCLDENNYNLCSKVIDENTALIGALNFANSVKRLTYPGAMRAHNRISEEQRLSQSEEEQTNLDRGWHEIAFRVSGLPTQIFEASSDAKQIRNILKSVEIDYPKGQFISLPTYTDLNGSPMSFSLGLAASKNPLSLGRILVFDQLNQPGALIAQGEIARRDGHILFDDCLVSDLQSTFKCHRATGPYQHLRDFVTCGIYRMIETGVLQEKVYLELDEDEDEDQSALAADDAPILDEAPSSEIPPAPCLPFDVDSSNMPIVAPKKQPGIGRNSFSYTRVMQVFAQLGVTPVRVERGKHVKLSRDGKTSSFLNPHAHQDPRHVKSAVKKALERLGIPYEDFESILRG